MGFNTRIHPPLDRVMTGPLASSAHAPPPRLAEAPVPAADLAAMTAACMKDDDNISDVDEDDPDLLVRE